MDELTGDVRLPAESAQAHEEIYRLVAWLRRMLLCAYMTRYGSRWLDEVDGQLLMKLHRRAATRNMAPGPEARVDWSPLLWMTTHEELACLLVNRGIWPCLHEFLGVSRTLVLQGLNGLADVATELHQYPPPSPLTSQRLRMLTGIFEPGIERFQRHMMFPDTRSEREDNLAALLDMELSDIDEDKPNFPETFYTTQGSYVDALISLPVEREGSNWVDVGCMLEVFQPVARAILAFYLNAEGDEYGVLLCPSINVAELQEIVKIFVGNHGCWTNRPYAEQDHCLVWSHKVWFYASQKPIWMRLQH